MGFEIPEKIVLARAEDLLTIFSYVSGMYGWIADGISSLFEPVTGQKSSERSGKTGSEEGRKRPGVKATARRQESHGRPVKRNYQRSVSF